MKITKDELKKIVELFYQHDFKIFYINSTDGKNFLKPGKAFVSLGITTNPKTLQYIANSITLINKSLKCTLGEIKSVIKGENQYLNSTVQVFDRNDIVQYKQEVPKGALSETDADKFLENLKVDLEKTKETYGIGSAEARGIDKDIEELESLVNRYRDSSNIWYYKENDKWTIFHECVNYKKQKDGEYRLGIIVEEI